MLRNADALVAYRSKRGTLAPPFPLNKGEPREVPPPTPRPSIVRFPDPPDDRTADANPRLVADRLSGDVERIARVERFDGMLPRTPCPTGLENDEPGEGKRLKPPDSDRRKLPADDRCPPSADDRLTLRGRPDDRDLPTEGRRDPGERRTDFDPDRGKDAPRANDDEPRRNDDDARGDDPRVCPEVRDLENKCERPDERLPLARDRPKKPPPRGDRALVARIPRDRDIDDGLAMPRAGRMDPRRIELDAR